MNNSFISNFTNYTSNGAEVHLSFVLLCVLFRIFHPLEIECSKLNIQKHTYTYKPNTRGCICVLVYEGRYVFPRELSITKPPVQLEKCCGQWMNTK